ncbi:tRNA pseudouridine(38-40) synthase TruA [Sphingobacteriales bacterium UPWRP_1]|nr:tRNA pseudouridine(38-40) synthase TruA [Sphingobacteriales bacterium TSM_CSS]PSJ77490.1 tRNA pseudouridine(38-40) synthase TruA [Sphingobacteriales bacterium UPWRP_1]
MPRFKLTLEYEGTRYAGWQTQTDGSRSIQGELVQAGRQLFNTTQLTVYGAGRTDAGVHALQQVAHLEVNTTLPPLQIRYRLNDLLPADIAILQVEKTHPQFHARHDAVARSYLYHIAKRRTAFGKKLVWWVKDHLDTEAMDSAAQLMEGFKDYRSFTDNSPEQPSTMVEVHWVTLHEYRNSLLIHITGSHFLWKMVRRMVGVLVEVGRGRLSVQQVSDFFTRLSREPATYTAPPSGLYLERVYYPSQPLQPDIQPLLYLL